MSIPFASLFSPGTAQRVGDNQQAIANTLDGNSNYWQAGNLGLADPGSAGGGIMQSAANIAAKPLTVDTRAMDGDAAKMAALQGIYANLFANGGLAEQAQMQAGNADIANSAQGGAQGIQAQIANSRKIMGQTSAVGTQERENNGGQANMSAFQVAQANLQKAMLQMQASHAAHLNAINAHAVQNYLGNQQISNDQNLYDAASGARSSSNNLDQGMSNLNFAMGTQLAMGGLAGASGASALASSFGTNEAPANTALSQGIDSANQLTLTAPSTQLRMATNSPSPYYPGALVNTYPASANAWALPQHASLIP